MSSAPRARAAQVVLDAEVDLDLANYTTTPYSLDLNANDSVPPRCPYATALCCTLSFPRHMGTCSGGAYCSGHEYLLIS